MIKSLALVLCTLFCFNSSAASKVVAEVNGKKITYDQFDKQYKQNLLFVGPKVVTKEKVLNDMINRLIGIEKAKNAGLSKDPIVKYKMEDILYHAQISKDLEGEFKKIKVTDNDVRAYYKNHPEYRTAQILLRMRAEPSKPEKEEALKLALRLYDQLKSKPERFSEFANKYSQIATAPTGGDVDFQPAVNLAPEYFRAIKGQKPGYITPPVRSQFGLHIVKVLAVKKFDDINMAYYKKLVYDMKRDEILSSYFAKSRKQAKISINKELLK